MLEFIYIFLSILTFIFFFVGITDAFRLEKNTRAFVLVLTTILFFILMFSSFSIVNVFCEVDASAWTCTEHSLYDLTLVLLYALFGILSLISTIVVMLDFVPEKPEEPEGEEFVVKTK